MEYSNSQVTKIINEFIHSERDRGIMIQRLTNALTIEQLAEKFEISESTVKRIIGRCSTVIFRHFPE